MPLSGAFVLKVERIADARGFFARTHSTEFLCENGLVASYPEESIAFNSLGGTLRGLHYQRKPFEETKLIRCTRGEAFDVIVDIRCGSPTFGKWISHILKEEDPTILYVPAGFAHGYQTLADATELEYKISVPYSAAHAAGVLWSDPDLGIRWPAEPASISAADAGRPRLKESELS